MVGWHHRFNALESERTPGDGEGQGSLACRSPRGLRVGHNLVTEQQQYDQILCEKVNNDSIMGGTDEVREIQGRNPL